jgi:hypothetical protein
MRLVFLMFSLLVLYQKANGQQAHSTTPLSPEEKLGNILISLAGTVTEISTCQEPVDEFEQKMRETTMEITGVNNVNKDKYKEFLVDVFNMSKNMKSSCVLFIAIARDLVSRIGYIEKYINKIPSYSEQKIGRLLKMISKRFNNIGSNSLESLEEIEGLMKDARDNLLSITLSSKLLRGTLKELYGYGPPVQLTLRENIIRVFPVAEMVYAQTDLPKDRMYKKKIEEQMLSFKYATEYSQIGFSTMENNLQSLEQEVQKIKQNNQEVTSSNSSITVDQWNLVLTKLQQARKVLDDYLKVRSNAATQNAVNDDNETAKNVNYEEAEESDLEVDYY